MTKMTYWCCDLAVLVGALLFLFGVYLMADLAVLFIVGGILLMGLAVLMYLAMPRS